MRRPRPIVDVNKLSLSLSLSLSLIALAYKVNGSVLCAFIYDLLACYSIYITCLVTLLANCCTNCLVELFYLHSYIVLSVRYGVVE
jgi:hypothetical protein